MQAALQKRDRAEMDGEERERKMLEDQIARARAAAGADDTPAQGLQKAEGEKVTLSLFPKPAATEVSASADASGTSKPADDKKPSTGLSFGSIGGFGAAKPAVANPLKRPAPVNVFKTAKAAKVEDKPRQAGGFVSEAERLMKEDLARKAARSGGGGGGRGGGPGGYQGAGPRR